MSADFLSAFEEAFEDEVGGPVVDDRLTTRNLIRESQVWLEEGGDSARLRARLLQMAARVGEAAAETSEDLERDRPGEELTALLEAMVGAYRRLDSALRDLEGAVAGGDDAAAIAAYREVEAADAHLGRCNDAVDEWERAPVLRCPNCGRQPEAAPFVCSHCRVEALYPDPEPEGAPRQVELGPEYVDVYEAYQDVVAGKVPMAQLWAALNPLEAQWRRYKMIADSEEAFGDTLVSALERISKASERSLSGATRMRKAENSRQTRDLNEGWTIILDAAVELQQCIPLIARAIGSAAAGAHQGVSRPNEQIDIEFD